MADVENHTQGERIAFGPFSLSPGERLLTRNGTPIEIGGRSFDLLVALAEQPGQVLSKRELLKRVWPDVVVEDGSLRFHMAGLRKLLGDGEQGARYIATQVGVGYAFVAPYERHGAGGTPMRPVPVAVGDAGVRLAPSSTNLPPRVPNLIGRERDITLLTERVVDSPVFTIVGPAGVGKTSLAVEIGHRLSSAFEDQVAFVDFAMLENPAIVPSMIAGAMGITVQTEDPLSVILGHIRDRPFLLVLDNCEHVITPAATIVERIIDEAPDVRILTTSREPLRVLSEHVHRLDALAYPESPDGLSLDELLEFPAVQLFYERASAADSSLVLEEEDARLIAEMCLRLDGMALPIELAAVRVATHGISATAKQLGERFSLGWAGRRTAKPRQQTLQATLDWSYDLLSDSEKEVLERLSVFVGPFSIDAALEVAADGELGADEVAVALDELASKSLVSPNRAKGSGTYRLLEMTRAYSKEKLRARGASRYHTTSRRHAGFFLSELEAAGEPDKEMLLDTRSMRFQLGNIRSALDWSFGVDGDISTAVRLAAASAPVFLNFSHLIECRTWCARALDALEDAQLETAIELELQGALGLSLMFTRGNSAAAGSALNRALSVATDLNDRWSQLCMLGRLHIFHERIGEFELALVKAQRAVDVAESIGTDEAVSVAYSLSGISHHLAGDQRTARIELEMALEKSPPSQRSQTIRYGFDHRNRSAIALARTLWLSGRAEQASIIAKQAVNEASKLNHPVTHSIALIWSLSVYNWMGDLGAAEEALNDFTESAEVNALGPYIAAAGGFRGELAIQKGETSESLGSLEESLSRLRAARYELLTTTFSIALSRGFMLRDRFEEALELVDATIVRCDSNGERYAMPDLMILKARIIGHLSDDQRESEQLLRAAIQLSQDQGAVAWELKAALELAELKMKLGECADARAVLQAARAQFRQPERTVDLDRADRLLSSMAS